MVETSIFLVGSYPPGHQAYYDYECQRSYISHDESLPRYDLFWPVIIFAE